MKDVAPPTWKEHLKTLRQKEHDPPPKEGVAARMRSAPTGKVPRGSKQKPTPLPASAKNTRAARLATRSGSPSVAAVTEKPKQGVLLLIRATLALYDTVGAYGYQRREGKIATNPNDDPDVISGLCDDAQKEMATNPGPSHIKRAMRARVAPRQQPNQETSLRQRPLARTIRKWRRAAAAVAAAGWRWLRGCSGVAGGWVGTGAG